MFIWAIYFHVTLDDRYSRVTPVTRFICREVEHAKGV
jgi:hypothetical protein